MSTSGITSKRWKILTNCSSIKRRVGHSITPSLSYRNLEDVCDAWVRKIQKSDQLKSVENTYGGRSFTEAVFVSDHLNADLHVISAGLGLVNRFDLIPNYNLTISQGSGSIAEWLSEKKLKSSDWWALLNERLNQPKPILNLLQQSEGIILAVPSTYLELISEELQSISIDELEKLYIITSPSGQNNLTPSLKLRSLPYDERLNGNFKYNGTRNDFPQRSLKHLVTEVNFKNRSISAVKKEILNFLDRHNKPLTPNRQKMDDERIKQIIKLNWSTYQGKSHSLHRYLRDDAYIACELKRFSNLWNEIKLEISNEN